LPSVGEEWREENQMGCCALQDVFEKSAKKKNQTSEKGEVRLGMKKRTQGAEGKKASNQMLLKGIEKKKML